VLGFDGAAGSKLEKRDGLYTGRFDGPYCYRKGKPVRMREIAERDGLDLAASWAYSDSESDLPMLRAVGHPVAVNPDGPLAKVAKEEGWDVMRFETLGRRLKVGAAVAAMALVGGGASRARRR
jgi:phosphoserine phosphatase